MLYSKLFTKTSRDYPSDEVSRNAQLLIRAGFIHKTMAGVYSFLPLGLKVLRNIENIVRDEMNSVGGQELLMTTLQSKQTWEVTDRWDDKNVDVWFKSKLKNDTEVGFGWSHEEAVIEMMSNHINSYKDLPVNVYQFQVKFRNELRAKSGIMRGREFLMKDMYSCSLNKSQHDTFYQSVIDAYHRVFAKCGIGEITYLTFADGGAFTQFSHEFQTICEAGEDTVYINRERKIAINEEVLTDEVLNKLDIDRNSLEKIKTAETGNIFEFGTVKSEQTKFKFTNQEGKEQLVYLGSYGIGISRLMGVIAEIYSDEKGLKWPKSVSPFEIHLITNLDKNDEIVNQRILDLAQKFHTGRLRLLDNQTIANYDNQADKDKLPLSEWSRHIEVFWDDRIKNNLGEKLKDADLIGIPTQIIISKRSLENGGVEVIDRAGGETQIIKI